MRFSLGPRGFPPFPPGMPFGPGGHASGGWEWGSHRGRRGGRAPRLFEPGELRLLLLELISQRPRHGYDLIRAMEDMSGGAYAPSPGVIYPTLTMLEDMGLIGQSQGQGSRRVFGITDEGRAEIEDKASEIERLNKRLTGLKDDQPRVGAPIGRAVGNLMAALWHRVSDGQMDESRMHEVASILDDTAQKIERL